MLKSTRSPFLMLKLCFIIFAFCLIYLSRKFPIQVPITDDWIYLELGTHQSSIFNKSIFELVNGHQHVLLKITIWLVGFIPGNYIQNLVIFNIIFALSGFYLLLVSQFALKSKSVTPFIAILTTIMVFNLKPLYIYMSATGLGMCQSVFLFGVYYYARNIQESKKSKFMIALSLFLATFSTAMGISLPIAHSLHVIYKLLWNRKIFSQKDLQLVVLMSFGIFISYIVPIYGENFNIRTPTNGTNSLDSVLMIFENPLIFLTFFTALVGNPLIPSSRFDPLFPFTLGIIVLVIFLLLVYRRIGFYRFFQTIMLNKNPFLTGFVFLFIVTLFRGSDQYFSLDSAAPRYIPGAIFLLIGMVTLIVENYSFLQKGFDKYLTISFVVIMSFSLAGIKSGSEWLVTRSSQSKMVHKCILNAQKKTQKCIAVSSEIREADSNDKELEEDLNQLQKYYYKLNNS